MNQQLTSLKPWVRSSECLSFIANFYSLHMWPKPQQIALPSARKQLIRNTQNLFVSLPILFRSSSSRLTFDRNVFGILFGFLPFWEWCAHELSQLFDVIVFFLNAGFDSFEQFSMIIDANTIQDISKMFRCGKTANMAINFVSFAHTILSSSFVSKKLTESRLILSPVNVIIRLMWSLFIVPLTSGDLIKTTGSCYQFSSGPKWSH